jgi:hypothetical protein
MKVTTMVKGLVAVIAAAGALAAQPATAAPGFKPLNPGSLPAMQRDLGLTGRQALAELAASDRADTLAQLLSGRLGDAYGGAVFHPETGRLEVAVADPGMLGLVRDSGADPKPVRFSARQLDSMVDQLNAREDMAPRSILSWGVDPENNEVTMTVTPGGRADAARFLAGSGIGSTVAVREASAPRPLYNVEGGDAYYIDGQARCSVGFAVTVGFLSAGHCAAAGTSITGYNRQPMGSFSTYRFPGADYSLARVNGNWTPRGLINNGTRVSGSLEAPIGTSVCKEGSTSGWTCGRISAKNQTVRYQEGAVTGLIETTVHGEPGDSGSPLIAGNQAQGLLSGGNSTTTYYYPVRAALSATRATLVTS